MALINDLITELGTAKALEESRVAGGEDLIQAQGGVSTPLPETLTAVTEKNTWENERLRLINIALSGLDILAGHGYPGRKAFSVAQEVKDDMAKLQKQMADFSGELETPDIGADSGTITVA
jgi:hypothetical protein